MKIKELKKLLENVDDELDVVASVHLNGKSDQFPCGYSGNNYIPAFFSGIIDDGELHIDKLAFILYAYWNDDGCD